MSFRGRMMGLALLGAVFSGPSLQGQSRIGGEFRVNQITELTQTGARIEAGQNGEFVVSWTHLVELPNPYTSYAPLVAFRFFDPAGRPVTDDVLPVREPSSALRPVLLPQGGARLSWGLDLSREPKFASQRFTPSGVADGSLVTIDPPGFSTYPTDFAVSRAGTMAFLWQVYDGAASELQVAYLTPRGRYVHGSPISISLDKDTISKSALKLDAQDNAVVVWAGECGPIGERVCDIFAQRLSPVGEKLGDPVRVNQVTAGLQDWADVAIAPDGSYLVVWYSNPLDPQGHRNIYGQLFSPSGERVGTEFQVNAITETSQLLPSVAADRFGNFAVVWVSYRPGYVTYDVRGHILRPDGSPVGTDFRINSTRIYSDSNMYPDLAFGGNGTLVAVWSSRDGDFDGVFAQRFAASPADEACTVFGRTLRCDTARTGGDAELTLPLLVSSGDTVLLGDVDGDGRADPCVRSGRQWLCDTEHRGRRWERLEPFGRGGGGETPLLGDVNGDGKAEACLFDAGVFSCDTAHDGGAAELTVRFGQRGDRALLGDVDGEGRADLCVVRGGRFLCDTDHNGGEPEVSISFDPGRGTPLLGDFDGDGRADPCFHDGRRFSCDTAHDGGEAEAVLRFGHKGDRPLLGNLDGL